MNTDEEFENYKQHYESLIAMGDLREFMIQEYVVKDLLQKILVDLDVIPTHTKIDDAKSIHDYNKYCGISPKSGKTVTPDLCIAKGWRWDNKNFDDYRAVVEVKSPIGFAMSYFEIVEDTTNTAVRLRKFDFQNISEIKNESIKEELSVHSQTNDKKKTNKIIFTDGITWFFIEEGKVKKRYDLGCRKLKRYYNSNSRINYDFVGIDWIENDMEIVDNLAIRSIFNNPIETIKAPQNFYKLIGEIKHFTSN